MPEITPPEDLRDITEPNIPPEAADQGVVEDEKATYEAEAGADRIKQLRAENKQRKQDRKERRKYANRVFFLISTWLGVMGIIVLCQGFSPEGFKLDTPVLVTLVSTTTASVLGIFLIVANYLFPNPKK